MIVTMSKALSANQIESYHKESYGVGDYYTQGGETPGEWFGEGAEMLGLRGAVEKETLHRVANGQHPHTGETLVESKMKIDKETGEAEVTHRGGWDMTMAFSKSVSTQATVDPRISEAAERVVMETAKEAAAYAQVRINGGKDRETTGNLVQAIYRHDTSRSVDGVISPHMHFHVVTFNMSLDKDGQARALDPREIYKSQKWLSSVGSTRMAQELQKLGYQVQQGKHGPEIVGYSREQIEGLSPRHRQIQGIKDEKGITDAANEAKVQRNTREWKQDLSPNEKTKQFDNLTRAAGVDREAIKAEALARGPIEISKEERATAAQAAVAYTLEHSTERESVADVRTVELHAAKHGLGKAGIDDIREEIKNKIGQGQVFKAQIGSSNMSAFTTKEMLDRESYNITTMQAGKGQGMQISSMEEVNTWLKDYRTPGGFELTKEQGDVLRAIVTSKDRYVSLEAPAGASKTTMMGALTSFLRHQHEHVQVVGHGPTTAAVNALKDAGVDKSKTAQGAIQEKFKYGFGQKIVHINDESSQWSTRMVNEAMQRAEFTSVGKVVWVGDQGQHNAVEAGGAIGQLQKTGMQVVRASEIYRQQGELKEVTTAFSQGRMVQGLDKLSSMGKVHEIADRKDMFDKVAALYNEGVQKHGDGLVLTSTHADRKASNEAVREARIAQGEISKDGYKTTVFTPVDRTKAQLKWAGSYEPGQELQYHFESSKYGLQNGDIATVREVNVENNTITVESAKSGKMKTYNPDRLHGVSVYRAEERVIAEGDKLITMSGIDLYKMANGTIWNVERVRKDWGEADIAMRDKHGRVTSQKTVRLDKLHTVDHGYASTSPHAQGLQAGISVTVDPRDQANAYVGTTRGAKDIQIVTPSLEKTYENAQRIQERSTAIDGVRKAHEVAAKTQEQAVTKTQEASKSQVREQIVQQSAQVAQQKGMGV